MNKLVIILTIHENGEADGVQYIVSEFVEGETLRSLMLRGQLDFSEATTIAEQVASALGAGHEAGIVHRDIKPENVMVRRDGLVKVLDFGLAKLAEAQSPQVGSQGLTRDKLSTEPGMLIGTVSYMSPEQARGLKVDHRTDIFSLGVMLYEMVAGRRPFEGDTASDIIAAILQKVPAPVGPSQSSPPEIDQVISRMIAKDRAARYQSVAELAALRQLQRKLEVDERSGPEEVNGGIAGKASGEAKQEGACVAVEKSAPVIGKTAATTSGVKLRWQWLSLALVLILYAFDWTANRSTGALITCRAN